jgi:hypothetical protein
LKFFTVSSEEIKAKTDVEDAYKALSDTKANGTILWETIKRELWL